MRLIDAGVVEDVLKKCVNNAYKRRDIQCATGVSLAILELRNIPTAYHVEKVVAELEKESQYCVHLGGKSFTGINLDKAIDIVQKGGVE